MSGESGAGFPESLCLGFSFYVVSCVHVFYGMKYSLVYSESIALSFLVLRQFDKEDLICSSESVLYGIAGMLTYGSSRRSLCSCVP